MITLSFELIFPCFGVLTLVSGNKLKLENVNALLIKLFQLWNHTLVYYFLLFDVSALTEDWLSDTKSALNPNLDFILFFLSTD